MTYVRISCCQHQFEAYQLPPFNRAFSNRNSVFIGGYIDIIIWSGFSSFYHWKYCRNKLINSDRPKRNTCYAFYYRVLLYWWAYHHIGIVGSKAIVQFQWSSTVSIWLLFGNYIGSLSTYTRYEFTDFQSMEVIGLASLLGFTMGIHNAVVIQAFGDPPSTTAMTMR